MELYHPIARSMPCLLVAPAEDNSEELKALWQSISLLTGRVEMMEVGCCCGVCCFLGGRMSLVFF